MRSLLKVIAVAVLLVAAVYGYATLLGNALDKEFPAETPVPINHEVMG